MFIDQRSHWIPAPEERNVEEVLMSVRGNIALRWCASQVTVVGL